MLIPSKLSRPVRQTHAVMRDRLVNKLSNAFDYRLILVTSPAGYGKTTMVTQWASEMPYLGWYSLDESDNQPQRFASYLVSAVQQATNGLCEKSEILTQKHQYTSITALFAQLFVELSEWQQPLYLVIDDYHLITNDIIHDGMRFFLQHQPENLTLVILSRNLPALGIAKLRVHGQLLEIDSQHLAFTHDEAKDFFDRRLDAPVSTEESHRLCDEVAGWATALQLIALSTHQSGHSVKQSAKRLSGLNIRYLYDYLVDEVLDRTDAVTRSFLLRCSVLRSMNAELITCITGEDRSQARLEETERQGLFIQRMDDRGEWFSFHPLFASFLRQRSQNELAQELPEIHKAAAQGWLNMGYSGEAIYHALSANNLELLRDILLQHAWSLFNHGELELLEECINALPYDYLIEKPKLILLQAWLAQGQHRHAEVNLLLTKAEKEITAKQIEIEPWLYAEFDVLRAQIAINSEAPDEAEMLAMTAIENLAPDSYYGRIVATSVIGEVMHCKGNLTEALGMMQQTEQMARHFEIYHYALWALLQQSEILLAQGFVQAAYEVQDKAFALVEEFNLQQLPMHEFLLRLRAQLLWQWARLDEAELATRKGMEILDNGQQQLQCLALLAKCFLARGNLDNARQYLYRCENLLSNAQYHSDWQTNADKPRVIYWQMTDDRVAAASWLHRTQRPIGAYNHFQHGQWRNIIRAQLLLGLYDEAEVILLDIIKSARQLQLVSELGRNLILCNMLYWHKGQKGEAQQMLIEALTLAYRTGIISNFVIEGESMAQQLRQLLQLNTLTEHNQHHAQRILRELNQHYRHKFAHFDENFVHQLLNNAQTPELIRTSQLTHREWQVLGLIYSGYSNDQIAGELGVASTTIKTHIRNLYQKIGVTHRQEAIQQAQQLLEMMGYNT